LTYRAFTGRAPDYLSELIMRYDPPTSLRTASDGFLLSVPHSNLVTGGDRAFQAVAPRLWNKLPLKLCSTDSLQIFKTGLKTYLYRLEYTEV